MGRRIRATQGLLAGTSFILGRRTIIGRDDDSDVQVIEDRVSRQHACLMEDDSGGMVLVDMSSSNGTFLGQQRIERARLNAGDEIRIGQSVFIYEELFESRPPLIAGSAGLVGAETRTGKAGVVLGSAIEEARPPCLSPLHEQAIRNNWAFCPACGPLANR